MASHALAIVRCFGALLLALAASHDAPAAGDASFTIEHDGLARRYRVHVPAGLDPARPAPLLVALHGGGGNMNLQADDERYGLIGKSDSAGFIAVFPNGFSRFPGGRLATWNAGACCGASRDKGVDDVGFVRAVVADVQRRYAVDAHVTTTTCCSRAAPGPVRFATDRR